MKILNLHVENIKRIKVVDISPDGNTVILSGKNGNGKSSTLDSIAMALGGTKLVPVRPVRDGEQTASIRVDLGDYVVTRHWTTPEKSYLKVEGKNGEKFSNGQTILNQIVGNLSFDPLAFSSMEPKKRLEVLKDITGLDFKEMDKKIKEIYDSRTVLGREGAALKNILESFGDIKETEYLKINIDELREEKNKAIENNKKIDSYKFKKNNLEADLKNEKQNIVKIKELLREKEDLVINMERELKEIGEEPTAIDLQPIELRIEEFYKMESKKERIKQYNETKIKFEAIGERWAKADNEIEKIQHEKKSLIENSKMPIKGLSFGAGDVFYNDIPFQQISTGEQIKISMAISMATNPKVKIAMINNGSLLDKSSLDEIKKIAKEKDYQVWIEKVSNGPLRDCIYIEDGEIGKEIEDDIGF